MQLANTLIDAQKIASAIIEETISDVTAPQARYLIELADNEGSSQTALCRETKIDRSTLADMSRRLIKKGYISRKRTREDARRYAVTLTDEGRVKVAELRKAAKVIDAKIKKAIAGADLVSIREQEAA